MRTHGKGRAQHHGKEQRKDDDSRKRGRSQVGRKETDRLRGEAGSGHS